MTRREAIDQLRKIAEWAAGDIEAAHGEADDILVALLDTAGFEEVTKVYKTIPKWYA